MVTKKTAHLIIMICILLGLGSPLSSAFAQEGDINESFDGETLPGWELSEGVEVGDGVMKIAPENFAVRFDGNQLDSFSFDFKRSGSGVIIFRYGIQEGREYALIIHDEAIFLEIGQEGPPTHLGESTWEASTNQWQTIEIESGAAGQQISLDGNLLFTTEEEQLLQGGGIGFWVDGESAAEFDNLILSGDSAAVADSTDETQPEPAAAGEEEQITPVSEDPGSDKMSINDLINELTSTQANPAQLTTFLINLSLAVVLSYVLSRVYIHWGSSLSNRRRFAANFILLTVTTTFIILVVRSSVALSLGLVGALSIVRFRSAIKEPEELAYLFFAIAIGIGLGDNQRLITVIALAVAILVLGTMRLFRGRQADFNLHVTVGSAGAAKVDFESVVDTLKSNCSQMKLIRFDESNQAQEISFLVEFRNMNQLKEAKSALRGLSDNLEISFLDNKGIW